MAGSPIDDARARFGHVGKFRFVAIVGATTLLLGAGPAASASQPEDRHCIARLIPVSADGGGVVDAILVDDGCYETYAAAIEAGTGGELAVSADISPAELTQSMLDLSLVAASDVLLGTEWDSTNFNGASHSYFAASGCANTTWQVANVGATWNDRFESGKGFGTCDHNRKFEHENFGGAVVLCTPNCGTYGALGNDVTSLRWAD